MLDIEEVFYQYGSCGGNVLKKLSSRWMFRLCDLLGVLCNSLHHPVVLWPRVKFLSGKHILRTKMNKRELPKTHEFHHFKINFLNYCANLLE